MRSPLVLCPLALCLSAVPAAAQDTWPQWRGPDRTATLPGADWPQSLAEDRLTVRWTRELGPSYSTPIVGPRRVYVTETADEKREVVRALDRATGEQVWETGWAGAMGVPFFAASNGSWIRSTPILDEDRLYVAGMKDRLVCLDAADGATVWQVDFPAKFGTPEPTFGFVCSPLVDGEFLYVQAGGGLVKLAKRSGEVVWRSLDDGGGMDGSAFSSPLMATLAGRRQLLVQARTRLVGVDPETGQELWSRDIPAFRGMNIVTPVVVGDDGVFTSSYGGGSVLLEISAAGDGFTVREAWKSKLQGYMSTPVLVGGHLYLHLRNQRFACLDAATGAEAWISRDTFGKYWSLATNGAEILALDEKDELLLLAADPGELRILDRRTLGDGTAWAHVAVAGDQVYVRELDRLVAYRWQ